LWRLFYSDWNKLQFGRILKGKIINSDGRPCAFNADDRSDTREAATLLVHSHKGDFVADLEGYFH
jgi:hypothetical protein